MEFWEMSGKILNVGIVTEKLKIFCTHWLLWGWKAEIKIKRQRGKYIFIWGPEEE